MPPSLPPPRLYDPSKDKTLLPQLAQIQADCITNDHQLATFLPPLDIPKMIDYWLGISEKVEKGEVAIILQLSGVEGNSKGSGEEGEREVCGYVYLSMPPGETGPFRGIVNKLMVSLKYRKMGVARRVMGKLEEVARERHRELLMLDTTIGTAADQVYPKLGYKAWGVLPKYGISPRDGSLVDERFYYKDLRDLD